MVSNNYLIYINGEIVAADKAKISVFDRGWLYGDGVFETMRTYQGRIFHLQDHLERIFKSAVLIRFELPWTEEELKKVVSTVLDANNINRDVLLRLTITRGVGDRGISLPTKLSPTLVVTLRNLPVLEDGVYETGRRAAIVSIRRNNIKSLAPTAKTLNFLNNILAKAEADEVGADEAIILNMSGKVTEGTVSNIFVVNNSIIKTPPVTDGLLPGISRKIVIKSAKEHNLDLEEVSLWPRDIYRADEVFITSTSVGIMPVTEVDGHIIGSGKVGNISKNLFSWFNDETKEP